MKQASKHTRHTLPHVTPYRLPLRDTWYDCCIALIRALPFVCDRPSSSAGSPLGSSTDNASRTNEMVALAFAEECTADDRLWHSRLSRARY